MKLLLKGMEVLKELIRAVRNIRSEVNTPLSKPITLLIKTNDAKSRSILVENTSYGIERFCNPEELTISSEITAPSSDVSCSDRCRNLLAVSRINQYRRGNQTIRKELEKNGQAK